MTELPPPSWANKVARGVWRFSWLVLCRASPRPLHIWRIWLLRLFGAKISFSAKVYPDANIWAPWNLEMGPNAVLGNGVDCYSVAHVLLEEGAVVSQRAFLCTASRNIEAPDRPLVAAPIRVGAGGWVAAEAFIGPGVEIGPGGVASARSVVFKDVPSKAIVSGNPASVKRIMRS